MPTSQFAGSRVNMQKGRMHPACKECQKSYRADNLGEGDALVFGQEFQAAQVYKKYRSQQSGDANNVPEPIPQIFWNRGVYKGSKKKYYAEYYQRYST